MQDLFTGQSAILDTTWFDFSPRTKKPHVEAAQLVRNLLLGDRDFEGSRQDTLLKLRSWFSGKSRYAVIDASLINGLEELLDTSGLEYSCLLDGEAAKIWGQPLLG